MLRVLGIVALACAGCSRTRDVEVRVDAIGARPNVVFILADDMGYGDPGCFNAASMIPTPHLDGLARDGMRFTDAHAPGAWCVPSRYGLLTGRYPSRDWQSRPRGGPVIDPQRMTLAGMLREQGYATAMVGKWHLGFEGGAKEPGEVMLGGPLDRGFERFFGIHASLDIPPYYYIRDRAPVAPPSEEVEASASEGWSPIQGAFWRAGGIAPGFVHADVQSRFLEESLAFLDERAGAAEPFFLYLALASPHTPWLPSAQADGKSGASMYGDFVTDVDDLVGEVLAALERNGQARDTIVFFTSDNGPVWYPEDVERLGHSATGPLRGMKSDAWEGGHRMPFLVRWPGRVPPESVSEQTLCFTDVMATLAEAAGAPLPEGAAVDSHSFLATLLDPSAPSQRRTTVLKTDASVLRKGDWKLITHLGSGGFSQPRRVEPTEGGPTGQLYDLRADPGEQNNLWSEHPDVVERLLAELQALAGD